MHELELLIALAALPSHVASCKQRFKPATSMQDEPLRKTSRPGTSIIDVKVRPNARASTLAEQPDGTWRAELKAQPQDGKANAELVALVAKHFGVPRAAVTIRSGLASRSKRVTIAT